MLSGSAEPECHRRLSASSDAAIGAEGRTSRTMTIATPADDAPRTQATLIAARATIHPTATAGCWAGSTGVN